MPSWIYLWECDIGENVELFDGLVQDCSISNALAMETLQSCTKASY